jgi:hypothetical protein
MIGQDTLPLVTIRTREANPAYEPIFVDGEQWPINQSEYYMEVELEAEVLQLNLNTGGMRVRYQWPERGYTKLRTVTKDVPISFFFDRYSIREVE